MKRPIRQNGIPTVVVAGTGGVFGKTAVMEEAKRVTHLSVGRMKENGKTTTDSKAYKLEATSSKLFVAP